MCLLSNPRRPPPIESGPRQRSRRGISRHPSLESGPHACAAAATCRVVHGSESDGGGAAGTLRSEDSDSVEAGIRWVRSDHVLIGRRCRRGTRCAPHSLARGPPTNRGRARLASGRSAPGPRDTGRHRLLTQDGSGRRDGLAKQEFDPTLSQRAAKVAAHAVLSGARLTRYYVDGNITLKVLLRTEYGTS